MQDLFRSDPHSSVFGFADTNEEQDDINGIDDLLTERQLARMARRKAKEAEKAKEEESQNTEINAKINAKINAEINAENSAETNTILSESTKANVQAQEQAIDAPKASATVEAQEQSKLVSQDGALDSNVAGKQYEELADNQEISLEDLDLQRFALREFNQDGFRLQRVDVYNWSSFNNNVKTVFFGGQNVLMTGDNGAGKSSIIDAITVLLYDTQKVVFNQAAGAEKNERNLASYVWGYYKNENTSGVKTELGLRSKFNAVLSVIMASFYSKKLDEHVVLIQALVINKQRTSPERFYFISNVDFNLQKDVLPVADVKEFCQKLNKIGCQRYKSFSEYYAQMQRSFGIDGTKVLDLFYKTISMKSISNISDFVRKQMLEDFDGDRLVEDIIERFDDLNSAYESVEEAKQQVDALSPISDTGENYQHAIDLVDFLTECHARTNPILYRERANLLKTELDAIHQDMAAASIKNEEYRGKLDKIESDIQSTKIELNSHGGHQRERLLENIKQVSRERDALLNQYNRHAALLKSINLEPATSEASFNKIVTKLGTLKEDYLDQLKTSDSKYDKIVSELSQERDKLNQIEMELQSLRNRRNNIPSIHIAVRERICQSIGCDEKDLPFAGELMQIRASEKDTWEFAIEKVLHNFAISMLVPDEYYRSVVNFVNTHNLGMKLVFYNIRANNNNNNFRNSPFSSVDNRAAVSPKSLVRKLEIKTDPVFQSYLKNELERRFNYVCTEFEDEFRKERMALMPSGLVKSGARNEKDDSKRGANNYVLGWTNEEKIYLLNKERAQQDAITKSLQASISEARELKNKIATYLASIERLFETKAYSFIDYKSKDDEIAKLNEEVEALKRTSDIVESLTKKLEALEEDREDMKRHIDAETKSVAKFEARQEMLQREYDLAIELSPAEFVELSDEKIKEQIAKLKDEAMQRLRITELRHDLIDKVIFEITSRLEQQINQKKDLANRLGQKLVNLQSNFTNQFVIAGQNLDSTRADAWVDFKAFLDKLQQDDLPRFVETFKEKLSHDTLEQFGTLNSVLNSHCRKIKERIAQINEIMHEVDFNPDHYIQMLATETNDVEIREFRADLKACTSNIINIDLEFEEADRKFHEVKKIIDRFKGREDFIDIDKRWRNKVTNVKMWFEFTASEHSRQDDSQVDYYEDSGGKSGGQKEKLAYTVLASSIAYQYRSSNRTTQGTDRSYRFVIIDEAFGRGSPQSVDYALTLFSKFNLQLLIATPMQKLDIIEKYVNHVAFVYRNEQTNESTVLNYELMDYILKRKLREQMTRLPSLMGKQVNGALGKSALSERLSSELGLDDNMEDGLSAARADEDTAAALAEHDRMLSSLSKDDAKRLMEELDSKIRQEQDKYNATSIKLEDDAEDDSQDKKSKSKAKAKKGTKAKAKAKQEDADLSETSNTLANLSKEEVQALNTAALAAANIEQASANQEQTQAYAQAHTQTSAGANNLENSQATSGSKPISILENLAKAEQGQSTQTKEQVQAQAQAEASLEALKKRTDGLVKGVKTRDEQGNFLTIEEYEQQLLEQYKTDTQQKTAEALAKLEALANSWTQGQESSSFEVDSIEGVQAYNQAEQGISNFNDVGNKSLHQNKAQPLDAFKSKALEDLRAFAEQRYQDQKKEQPALTQKQSQAQKEASENIQEKAQNTEENSGLNQSLAQDIEALNLDEETLAILALLDPEEQADFITQEKAKREATLQEEARLLKQQQAEEQAKAKEAEQEASKPKRSLDDLMLEE